jgi:hypothetical protein
VSAGDFLRYFEAWRRVMPIRAADLTGVKRPLKTLAASPLLARLSALELSPADLRAEGVRIVAQSPHLANLTELTLNRNAVGDAGLQALAASPHLARLRRLLLGHNPLTPHGRAARVARFGAAACRFD